ncbi:molybdopterin-dependent oxidoreductase [Pseudaminobacter salicylatoxidans]|uniref:SorA family sulfite dehydrogenase catalytic subunit n=1 Tax=Pseudaminobacter salicylatoxidans TaxID=93369 RepID=UPI000300F68C|nr:molybdopterin-dependent oxidoreductase [Pseudaminobacter salicylatoxidans]
MISRRQMLKTAGSAALGAAGGLAFPGLAARAAETVTLPFANGERPLVRYPGKRPLIGQTARPPQLETPFSVFNEGIITPNDAFFVRYHLADIPLEIDPEAYRVEVKGLVDTPLSLSLDELKALHDPVELVAVHQCSGNSRGFFEPRMGGGQLANGAMGNARWKGVPLKALLDKAGVKAGAVQVSFNGMDGPALPETPDFVKALDLDHAGDGEVMIAYAMNGEDLPWLNGFPVRLVVPGWYGTYWIKHLTEITVLDKPLDNFWMKTAYRIPDNDCACTEPGKPAEKTVPINKFSVRSFVTSVLDGDKVAADAPLKLRGIAFDGGSGIKEVAVSIDDGKSWMPTDLGEDLGKYSFREWTSTVKLPRGEHVLKVRATGNDGKTQPEKQPWNPSGYMRNVVETTKVVAA